MNNIESSDEKDIAIMSKAKKYWSEIGEVSITDANNVKHTGYIIDFIGQYVVIQSITGNRSWISNEMIVSIEERKSNLDVLIGRYITMDNKSND